MKDTGKLWTTIRVLVAALVLGLAGCADWSVAGHGHRPPGPQPHAPAHGYRAKEIHRFYYYPDVEVYFDPVRGSYFWFAAGSWCRGAALPRNIVLNSEVRVTVELDTDKPYTQHDKVKQQRPGKGKGKGGWKGEDD